MEGRPDDTPEGGETAAWNYGGYTLRPAEFNNAMIHLYRGEVARSNTWRTRLDTTTNWAVVTIAAMLSFAFSSPEHHHVVLLLAVPLMFLFLYIESRRYRYYELWALRVRLMESDFFAAMLAPPFRPSEDWARLLNQTLLAPQFPVGLLEAIGRRLRHNYLGIFFLVLMTWVIKLILHPTALDALGGIVPRAAVGPFGGGPVLGTVAAVYAALLAVAALTRPLQDSAGEVLPRHKARDLGPLWSKLWPRRQRRHLAFIITDRGQQVADRLLNLLQRGVTGLSGTGMWTGEERTVLLCAVGSSEIEHLRTLVNAADPEAFVVVNPTHDVLGGKFELLRPSWRGGEPSPRR